MATKLSMPAMPTLTSQLQPPENKRTTSFPTYLDGAAESFVLNLGVLSSTQQHDDHVFLGKNTTVDDPEIDVFDAHKYFNEGLNRSPCKVDPKKLSCDRRQLHKKDEPVESTTPRMQTLRSTRSESSTNSRSTLLHNNPTNLRPRKSVRKGFLASIGCSCADRNSVDIDDCTDTNMEDGKLQQGDKIRDHTVRKTTTNMEEEDQAKRKAAIEVSVSSVLGNRKNSLSLEKKLNMMSSWDAIAEEIKNPSVSSEMKDGDDSDGSSDLFEIESFSRGRGSGQPFLSRQESNGLFGSYAPSEASIEWSVVTASAADLSVVSDSEELGAATDKIQKGGQNSKISTFKEIPKLRSGILSGCKSQKAVSVAGDAHRASNGGRMHLKAAVPFAPMARFRDENKLGGYGAKIRPQSLNSTVRVLPPQLRSGNAAHLLYT